MFLLGFGIVLVLGSLGGLELGDISMFRFVIQELIGALAIYKTFN
jgi:hypothetical protein